MDTHIKEARIALKFSLEALQHSDWENARRLAYEAIELSPEWEHPWLVLAFIAPPSERLGYIQKALLLNPDSHPAQQAQEWANHQLKVSSPPEITTRSIKLAPIGQVQASDKTQNRLVHPEPARFGSPLTSLEEPGALAIAKNRSDPNSPARTILRTGRYLVGKFLMIALTIFIGVFITILITSQPTRRGLGPPESPFETSLKAQLSLIVQNNISDGSIRSISPGVPDQSQVDALRERLQNEMGLNLPFFQRNLLWTVKALTFDWGQFGNRTGGWGSQKTTASARDVLFEYLPNTLLLVTTTYLLVFLIGMPMALYLARNYGKWMDRFFAFLSPISSVPAWVVGILLISLFAFQLHWFPFSGMYEFSKPVNKLMYVSDIAKHMVLPVSAFVLSLLFQVIYAW